MITKALLSSLLGFFLVLPAPSQTTEPKSAKEKKEARIDAEKLTGKWVMVKVESEDPDTVEELKGMTLILQADGSFKLNIDSKDDGQITFEGKYKVKKRKLVLKDPGDELGSPKISFRGENLVLSEDDDVVEFKKEKERND